MSATIRLAIEESRQPKSGEPLFLFSKELPVFSGHFPGNPILPAIYQIETALYLLEEAMGCPLAIGEVRRSSFILPIKPDQPVVVRFDYAEVGQEIEANFRFSVNGKEASQLKLRLLPKEPAPR